MPRLTQLVQFWKGGDKFRPQLKRYKPRPPPQPPRGFYQRPKFAGFEANYPERLSLEAWHSSFGPNTGKDHITIPEAYKGSGDYFIPSRRRDSSPSQHSLRSRFVPATPCYQLSLASPKSWK